MLGVLGFIVGTVFKSLFGKAADSLEKGVNSDDECEPFAILFSILLFFSIPLITLDFGGRGGRD